MNVLIIEDDSYKAEDIQILLRSIGEVSPTSATSVVAAITAVRKDVFDLIIVDMALPSHPLAAGGGAPLSMLTGGVEVLFELQSMGRVDNCVVITQYPEIEICGALYPVALAGDAIREHYDVGVIACLEYSQTNQSWRSSLADIFTKICKY
jgi:CheY-like chemotaxis protein